MADGPVCGAGLFRLSLRGAIARGFICVHGLFVTYEYHSPFFFYVSADLTWRARRRKAEQRPRAPKTRRVLAQSHLRRGLLVIGLIDLAAGFFVARMCGAGGE